MRSHGQNQGLPIPLQYPAKRKGKPAAPTVLKNTEISKEQEDICRMTLTASKLLIWMLCRRQKENK